jgi:hypothetical protein
MLKPNIGILNSLVRITCGFTFLSLGTARLVRRPWRQSSIIVILLSAMKVAEGIVRYCPVVALMKSPAVANSLQQKTDKELPISNDEPN